MRQMNQNLNLTFLFRSMFYSKKPKMKREGLIMQVNGDKVYRNAKVFYEDGMLITYTTRYKTEESAFYNWEDISSISYK